MRLLSLLTLCVLLHAAAPAAAQAPLSAFEEPHSGSPESGGVFPFLVTEEAAGEPHILIYRNHPQLVFNLSVVAPNGTVLFEKAGTRGIQTLPPLEAGSYRFVIARSQGEFQVAPLSASLTDAAPVDTTLQGEADAYVLYADHPYNLTFGGNVTIESFNLQSNRATLAPNATLVVEKGQAWVFTVRGEPGTPYTAQLEQLPDREPVNDTPGFALPLLALALVAALALGRRRPPRHRGA